MIAAASNRRRSQFLESALFWAFRIGTYFVLLCATYIFLDIGIKGGRTVFTRTAPFVNLKFLSEPPQTLYVFDYQGKKMELSDREFRDWKTTHKEDVDVTSVSYSAGGIWPCIVGTALLVIGSMTLALFIGISCAIYLSEYSRDGRFIRLIRIAILNLAGVPSIVFGLFGFGLFVIFFGWNVSLLSGWFTLGLMVLPAIITASEESLRAVPQGLREGSLALGATKWQTIRKNVLPYALPGILTSSILGIARVAGETAPIMFTAAYAMRDEMPWQVSHWTNFFFQGVMALPYHIYVVSSKIPQNEYTERVQYGTAFVFLAVVMLIALTSILLRERQRRRLSW
ncbi:MAG TPA: phosphate ABC transporter permease PstA [Chthoniobacterales bacterium]|jgi:phosphate transport system permease protein|nr:MAG: phosphate ABC transporter permease PtsA [Verrucomicrobiota bacterium]PYL96379.1 MAG: phosphate ABC transporter permease PtsA [Verrucomicrobiota bacterium]HYS95597.1 phosphate ABC transporter permease PstA [Chthoniobacterales bacterium]